MSTELEAKNAVIKELVNQITVLALRSNIHGYYISAIEAQRNDWASELKSLTEELESKNRRIIELELKIEVLRLTKKPL